MKQRDILRLMDDLGPIVAAAIVKATAPLLARIAVLEKHLGQPKSPTTKELAALATAHDELREMVLELPKPPTAEEVAALVPVPKDGIDGKDGRDGVDGKNGAPGRDGKDGADGARGNDGERGEKGETGATGERGEKGDQGDTGARGEAGERGEKGETGDRGEQGPAGEKGHRGEQGATGDRGEKGEAGAAGKDGIGLVGVLKDHEGNLAFTMTDGTLVKVGLVDGKDGAPGRDYDPDVLRTEVKAAVQAAALAPLADAYKGVWKVGAYRKGDAVTWAGSLFIAKADTDAKPESNEDWQLAVKRGRDGKDGEAPKPPPKVKL